MDESIISRAIIERYMEDFLGNLNVDVAIAGAGPSGLVCAYYLAKNNVKVVIFERSLRLGGGMPGGGMMFNHIVVQKEAKYILDEFDINYREYQDGLFTASALETISTIYSKTVKSGAKIFNLVYVEDVVIRSKDVCGLVLNWSAVNVAGLHIDPLAMKARAVVDATGHDSEICRIIEKKMGAGLNTENGKVQGEKSMWAEAGEREIIKNTSEVYPGLFVCGMAANAVFGSPRMGAIFGGMFMSGKKLADLITDKLSK